MAEAQLKQKNKKRVLSALSCVFLVGMIGAGAYAALGSVATVDNEISIGAVNISLEHYYQRDNVETKGTYNDEDITSVGAISSVPRITNLGIGSYIRLAVRYYDEKGNLAERAAVSGLGADWQEIGDYYYLTREAVAGEVFDVFNGISIPDSWGDDNSEIVMFLQADAIQAANFNPDFSSAEPWGSVTIEDYRDKGYQIDSEERASAVTVSYDDGVERYVEVPEDFLARLNLMRPGDTISGSIRIDNSDGDAHEIWISADATDDGLGAELILRIENGSEVIYEGPLNGARNVSLGNYAPGETADIVISLSLPIETGNDVAGLSGSLSWRLSTDTKDDPIPPGPSTYDKINTAMVVFLISFVGLMIVALVERRKNEEEA